MMRILLESPDLTRWRRAAHCPVLGTQYSVARENLALICGVLLAAVSSRLFECLDGQRV